MAIMVKRRTRINKEYIDKVIEQVNFNKLLGITISQRDLARQYKIEIDDILEYCLHAERFFYSYNHYDILYKTNKGYTYNIIIVIE